MKIGIVNYAAPSKGTSNYVQLFKAEPGHRPPMADAGLETYPPSNIEIEMYVYRLQDTKY